MKMEDRPIFKQDSTNQQNIPIALIENSSKGSHWEKKIGAKEEEKQVDLPEINIQTLPPIL